MLRMGSALHPLLQMFFTVRSGQQQAGVVMVCSTVQVHVQSCRRPDRWR